MAARIGSLAPGQPLSTVGVPVDNRRDMARELMAAALVAQLSAIEGVLQQIVLTGEKTTDKKASREAVAARVPTSGEVQRALQNLQRDNGLVVTGRFDEPTGVLLQRLGLVPTLSPTTTTASSPPPPTTTTTTTTATAKPAAPTTTTAPAPAPERKPVDVAARQQTRAAVEARDAQLKNMMTAKGFSAPPSTSTSTAGRPLDRMLDPARLMASLFAAGITAPSPQAALSTFQGLVGLPPTGQLDPKTMQALVVTGRVPPSTADSKNPTPSSSSTSTSASAAPSKTTTTSAATASSSSSSANAVKETKSATAGSGAATAAAPTTSTATRTPAASPEAAREQARVESLLAQAAATERGVQEGTGDPTAVAGHGDNAGASTGLTGVGGDGAVADVAGTEVAVFSEQSAAGNESSVGNTTSGDDDHLDERRGEAVDAQADEDSEADVADEAAIPDGHYKVPKLSAQVAASLKEIARLDDGTVPVHYTWDVTLYRPGVYADGQPAEAVWHLVVERAHAFDAVWSTAVAAIAMRLLTIEPDAEPPALEELLGALRQARVR